MEKKINLRRNIPEVIETLTRMSDEIAGIYGDVLDEVILYGSYAYGGQNEESDIDIALMLKEGETEQMHEAMHELVVDYELNMGVTLSVISIEFSNYLKWHEVLPFYKNIDSEGIVLWKACVDKEIIEE